MTAFGELFAKPFCRLTATLSVFIVLFGFVGIIENAGNKGTFFFFCVIYGMLMMGMALVIANSTSADFEKSKNTIRTVCIVSSILMLLTSGVFVQRAPTTRAASDKTTMVYSDAEKSEVWVASALGTLMLCFITAYASRFGDNVDEYTKTNMYETTEDIQTTIDYLNTHASQDPARLFYYLEYNLKTPLLRKRAALQSNLTQVAKSTIVDLIRDNDTTTKIL